MQVTIGVSGMSCKHCADRVKKAIEEVQGVKKVWVDLTGAKAVVDMEDEGVVSLVKEAVRQAGYKTQ